MRKLISYMIAIMMVFTMMPYTAFSDTDNTTKSIELGTPEEVAVDLFVNSKITIESDNTSVAKGTLTGNALVISEGSAIYRNTIRIMPVKTGSAKITVKADGKVATTFNINVVPAVKTLESHVNEKPVIEYVSYFDGELTNTNTDNVTATLLSKTKRITTENINGISLKETQYVYKIQIEYKQIGQYDFSLIGSESGEFYKIKGKMTDHKWGKDYVVDVEPGCTTAGKESIHCELCELTKNQAAIPEAGHNYSEWIIEKTATCIDEGSKYKVCNNCDAKEEQVIEQLEHEYKWVVDIPATAETPGVKHEVCTQCGSVRSEETAIDQITHTHVMDKVPAAAATCTITGNIEHYACSECNGVFADEAGQLLLTEKELVVKAPGHDYGNWTIETPATCDKGGVNQKLCQRCGDKKTEASPALGHTIEKISAAAATCTKPGRKEGSHCTNCGKMFVVPEVIPATGHDFAVEWSYNNKSHWYECACGAKNNTTSHKFEWIVDREATVNNPGLKHEECKVCEAVRNEDTVIEQLEHTHAMFKIDARTATCTTDGNIDYYICIECNNCYLDETGKSNIRKDQTIVKAAGHVYGKWLVMNQPTCSRIGYEFNSCMTCGLAEIRELPRKEHILEYSKLEPTCTTDGADIVSCEKCKYRAEYVLPAFGHKSQVVMAVAPTCTKDGATGGVKCSTCGTFIHEPKVVPATGHKGENWIVDKEPTCSVEGIEHRICEVCGETENRAIQKVAHTPVALPTVIATCKSVGLTEGVCCGVCSEIIVAQQVIPMHEHEWETEYTVDISATINRAGSKSYHCANCDIIKKDSDVVIPQIKKTTVDSLIYNGSFQTPVVKVVDYAGKQLVEGKSYIVTYREIDDSEVTKPKNIMKYKAKVTFIGDYSGYVVKQFTVVPKKTSITKLTKGSKQFTVKWTKHTAQVTGYEIQYSTTKGFTKATTKTVKVANYKTNTKTVKNLKTKKKYWVKVRTYKLVDGIYYYSAWCVPWIVTTK